MDRSTGDSITPLSIKEVVSLYNYRQLWSAQIVSNFGDALTILTLILLINEISGGSATAIAGLFIAVGIPAATISLVAGALVDRLPKKPVLIWSDLLTAILVVGYILFALLGGQNIFVLYSLAFVHASINAFFSPAKGALIPQIVPENGLMSANSLSQMTRVIAGVLGTAAAGLVVGLTGLYWLAFLLDIVTFLVSIFFISRVRFKEPLDAADNEIGLGERFGSVGADLRSGFGLLLQRRILIGCLIGFAFAMLGLGAVNVLLPPFIINDLQISEAWFGLVELFQSVGMVLSGILVGQLAARFKETRIATVALFIVGIAILFFVTVSSVIHLFPILFTVGLVMTPLQAAATTLLQTNTPREMMGRVSGALNAVIQIASLTSMFAAGILADWIGLRTVFVVGGLVVCGAAVMMGLIFWSSPVDAVELDTQEVEAPAV